MTAQPNRPHEQASPAPATSFAHSLKIVAWGLLGIRKGSAHRSDATRITPVHIALAGLLALLAFVGVLVGVVRWIAPGA